MLRVEVSARFVRTENESITKKNGSRYQAMRLIASVQFSTRSSGETFVDQQSKIAVALKVGGGTIDFVAADTPAPPAAALSKRQSEEITALQQENKRLKQDLAESQSSLSQSRRAAIFQQSLERSAAAAGEVIMLQTKAEAQVMSGVKWRPVATTIVFDANGSVESRGGHFVYKRTYYQLRKCGYFDRWIRYEIRAGKKLIGVSWISHTAQLFQSIREVKAWVDSQNAK